MFPKYVRTGQRAEKRNYVQVSRDICDVGGAIAGIVAATREDFRGTRGNDGGHYPYPLGKIRRCRCWLTVMTCIARHVIMSRMRDMMSEDDGM
jgi:hypothetical protein